MRRLWPSRERLPRMRTIRGRILTLLWLPLVPFLAIWLFATSVTIGPAVGLYNSFTTVTAAGDPAAHVVYNLQIERQLMMVYVNTANPQPYEIQALENQEGVTDGAVRELITKTADSGFRNVETDLTRHRLELVLNDLTGRSSVRARAGHGETPGDVMVYYNAVIEDSFALYESIGNVDDAGLSRQAATVIGLTEAREMLNRENAVVTGVYAAGTLTPANARELAGYVTTQRYLYEQAARYLTGDIADTYSAIHTSTAYGRLAAMEDQLSLRAAPNRNGIPTGINIEQWRADFNQIDQQLLDMESAAEALTLDQAKPFAYGIVAKAAIAGIVGLIVLVVLIVVSLRIARRIIRRIETLRADALHLAFDRLPDVVGRLRAGEEVDPAQVAPEPHTGDDELAQLTEAFGRVQTTAITSAVQEAALRNGLNKVFLNIARRSQTLLHRQLALLDGMERRTADPDDLEELFRIDHLATRMRRHAEDLVILAGSTPGRAWRNPVSVTDVLRAAASEVEQYQRVIVRPQPDLALSGRAVGDVVHLIAELLENATQYSPPDTEVTVTGQAVPNGLAIDIDDRGLGVTAAALDDINTRLADPPEFDPAASLRLGLYVVARLAHKHGIRVTLRQSAYGGITAVVLLPPDIVVAGHHAASYPAGRAGDARPTARALTAGPDVHPGDDEPTDPGIGPRSLVLVSGGLVSRGAANDAAPAPGPTAPGLAADGPTAPGLAADGPTAPGLTADGLPQRVRQSARPAGAAATMGGSTAPAGPAVTTLAPAAPAPARAAARSPQDMRRMLTSFQAGMRRGRIDATHEHIATPEHHEEGPPR